MPDAPHKMEDTRGKGFPQILHERARKGAEEIHKFLLSLATAAVGVFFLALTGKIDPPLTGLQKIAVLTALFAMAVAALAGLACWYADSRRNYFWAAALQSEDKERRGELYASRDKWLWKERLTARLLKFFFVVGITCALIYLTLRVLNV